MESMSLNEMERKIRGDFCEQFKESKKEGDGEKSMPEGYPDYWVKDVYPTENFVVVEKEGDLYKVKYTEKEGNYTFDDMDSWKEGKMIFEEGKYDSKEDAMKEKDKKEEAEKINEDLD